MIISKFRLIDTLEAENPSLAWYRDPDNDFNRLGSWNAQISDFHISADLDRYKDFGDSLYKLRKIIKFGLVDPVEAENQYLAQCTCRNYDLHYLSAWKVHLGDFNISGVLDTWRVLKFFI